MKKVGLIIGALIALALTACGSEPEPPPGIGVSRQEIQSLYEQPDIGFTFEPSELADGTPRVIGESPDGIAFLELIGPERDITKATIMAAMPSDDTGAIAMNAAYMLGLLNHLVPDWSDGGDWLAKHFAVAADEGEARTIQGNVEISLTAYRELGMVLLTVESLGGDQSSNENRAGSDGSQTAIAPLRTPTPTATVPPSIATARSDDYQVMQGPLIPFASMVIQELLPEVSRAELDCIVLTLGTEWLIDREREGDFLTEEEGQGIFRCLEHETALRLFLTPLVGGTGPLSTESSVCIRAGFEDVDLTEMFAIFAEDPDLENALHEERIGIASSLIFSCLTEAEWERASSHLDMSQQDRESVECRLDELGGPEELAARLQPDANSLVFSEAVEWCDQQ